MQELARSSAAPFLLGRLFFLRAGAAWGLAVAFCGEAKAASPAPSQVTPETFAPKPALSKSAPDLPQAAPLATPAGAQGLTFRLRRIVVSGAFAELESATADLTRPFEGKQITVAQLFALATAVEKLYSQAGYPLVRVNIPPQKLQEGGDARFEVIDGFIETISLDAVPERARGLVSARIDALVKKKHLKYSELERAVLLAGDVVGLRLRSALARGKSPGGVILVLEGDARLVSASLGSDNNLPDSLGSWQWNARLSLNNALGLGEQAYLSLASGYALGLNGFPMSPLRTLGAGFIAPLGKDGFTVNPEITQSLTRPAPEGGPPNAGEFDRFALRGSFPIERRHDETLTLTGAVEAVKQQIIGAGVAISEDRYAAARVGANWQGAAFWGAPVQADVQVSQGLGGQEPDSAHPGSRAGARPVFSKVTGDVRLSQPVGGDVRFDFAARAQTVFRRPMLASEQFSLDGADGVSAFTQGAFSVDEGEVTRLEASRPVALPIAAGALSLSPYLFAAQGYGVLLQPTGVEPGHISAVALGLGARLSFDAPDGFTGLGFGVELGHGLSNVAGKRAANRIAFTINMRY